MLKLTGTKTEGHPIRTPERLEDLLYYDGPLLSHLTDGRDNHFLQHWCDNDDSHNRWAIMRVTEAIVLRLRHNIWPLNLVVPEYILDDFVYYIDLDEQGKVSAATKVWVEDMPEEYAPRPGSFCDEPIEPDDSFTVLIDGEWSLQEWGKFPHRLSQVYSVLYGHKVLRVSQYKSHPWREGFSSMHFYNDAIGRVPIKDRAGIQAMQFASPGFMRFRSKREVAGAVVRCVEDLEENDGSIFDAASDIDTFCRNEGLNKAEAVKDITKQQNEKLEILAKKLLSGFSEIDPDRFIKACPSAFEAAKISVSFYRRVKDLWKFETTQQISYPRVVRND